jgi:hypothetical protein
LLDFVEAWWLSVRAFLGPTGVVGRFERSPNDRSNPSCVLNLRRNELEADLVVWQSGEAELGVIDSAGWVNQRHFDDVNSSSTLGEIFSTLIGSISDAREAEEQIGHETTERQRGSGRTISPNPPPLTDEELDQIQLRADLATKGPWKSYIEGRDEMSGSSFIMTEGEDLYLIGATDHDQDFIASARTDILKLVQEIRRLRDRL